jgi:hypothetical protein
MFVLPRDERTGASVNILCWATAGKMGSQNTDGENRPPANLEPTFRETHLASTIFLFTDQARRHLILFSIKIAGRGVKMRKQ